MLPSIHSITASSSAAARLVTKFYTLVDQFWVLAQRRVHVGEEHADVVELLLDLVVDDLGLVLRAHAAEVLLLRLGDPELVPGAADVLGQVLPVLGLLLGRADEVVDVVEVD